MSRPTRLGRPAGFTMVEIILVVVIVGLIAGLGLPAMKSRLHRARMELKERVEAILGHALEEQKP